MVIPIGDVNPTRRTPWFARLLLVANIAVFVLVQPWADEACAQLEFFLTYAAVPAELMQGAPLSAEQLAGTPAATCGIQPAADKNVYLAVLWSMFLHAGWLHLLFNMLYLGIFGNNVEDRFGHLRFLAFYLAIGAVATVAFVAQNPASTSTLVGASGAIAGVLGAYLVLYPRARVTVTVPLLFFAVLQLPAVVVLGMWFILELQQLRQPEMIGGGGGVAYMAHVAGFVAGSVTTLLLGHRPQRPQRFRR
jgi:membrane associated rhomboid family serine protease